MILPHPFTPRSQLFFSVLWQRSFIKMCGVVQAGHAVVRRRGGLGPVAVLSFFYFVRRFVERVVQALLTCRSSGTPQKRGAPQLYVGPCGNCSVFCL